MTLDFAGIHRILKKFLDGYYQDIGWFVRLLILVNQLVTKVHVDKHVDKSNTARFYLFRFYGINRKITILQVFVLLFNR